MNNSMVIMPLDYKLPDQISGKVFFSPSSIVAIFNAATVTKEEKKIIQVRGVFKKSGTSNYNGNYYNKLKEEASDYSITLITSALIHHQLADNKTIEFNAFITRRLDKQGRIELIINFIELISQRANKFSEEETKKIVLINQKVTQGFKDLDAHIKTAIYNNRPINIKIIMGRAGIIDADIKQALEVAISLYNIDYHRISLSSAQEIIDTILDLDNSGANVICVARGGGDNLSIFENLEICSSILQRKTIIASAIGHAEDVTLFEKLADKKFITPTQFGNYLKEIYNQTVEELAHSKARLVQDITNNLSANFNKQIQNLTEQLCATKAQNEKVLTDTNFNHHHQIQNLLDKSKAMEEIGAKTSGDKISLHTMELKNIQNQLLALKETHSDQLLQLNQFQDEKFKTLNEYVESLLLQQAQNERLTQQSDNLATTYKKQLQQQNQKFGYGLIILFLIIIAVICLCIASKWLR